MTDESLEQRRARLSPAKRALLEQRLKGGASTAAMPRRPEGEPARLAPEQRGLWTLHRVAPDDPAYHLVSVMRVAGALDIGRLEEAIQQVVARHRILRSAWEPDGDSACQVIKASAPVRLERAAARGDGLAQVREWAAIPFDLGTAPLLRVLFVKEEGDPEDWLAVVLPHLICDERGLQTFWQDLTVAYRGEAWGDDAVQADDVVWARRETLPFREADLAFWQAQLAAPHETMDLSGELPGERPTGGGPAGRLLTRAVDSRLVEQVEAFARARQVTPFAVYLAATLALLQRVTGQQHLSVGCPVSTRERPEEQAVIGYFLNTLVLTLPAPMSASFAEGVSALQEGLLAAMEHRRLPFDQLVEALQPARIPGQPPWFQTMMVMVDDLPEVALGEARLRPELVDLGVAKFDLTLFVAGRGAAPWVGAEFRTASHAEADIDALLVRYLGLLQQAMEQPDQPMQALEVVTPAETNRLLSLWQGSGVDVSRVRLVRDQILQRCLDHPDETALIGEDSTWSYGNLEGFALRVHAALQEQGVQPGDRVAIRLERSPEMVGAILGVHCAGAAYVPLDPAWPAARNQQVLEDADVAAVITSSALADGDADSICVEALPADRAAPCHLREDLPAYLLYTSGSTGRPKGVVVTQANLRASTEARLAVYREAPTVFLLLSGFAFDSSVAGLFWTLATGGRLVIPGSESARDPGALRELIARHAVSHLLGIPSMIRELIRSESDKLSSLRTVIAAGETCPRELVMAHREAVPDAQLCNEYGPTEATVWTTMWEDDRRPLEQVPIGGPVPHARVYVLDEHRRPVLPGNAGIGWIGGAGVAQGYWRRDALTEAHFCPDPFDDTPGARMYDTGDRVRWRPDGQLEFLGRADDQLKVQGVRLEPGDIECAVLEQPGIREACVVLQPPPPEAGAAEIDRLAEALDALPEAEVRALLDAAAKVQAEPESAAPAPERTVDGDGFGLAFSSDPHRFLQTPRPEQRDWMLSQALDEWVDDLRALDRLASQLVPGEGSRLREQYPDIAEAALSDQEIMEDWQVPLMEAMADFVTEGRGDVLEIGFGRGVSAELIQQRGVRSHTIVEPNPPSIHDHFHPWRQQWPDREIQLREGRWQDVLGELDAYDGIFFHAFPLNEKEFIEHVLRSVTYAEHAIPELAERLRPGGVFTYLSTEVDSLSRRHQRMLFQHFATVTTRVVPVSVPADTRDAWWAPQMVVVRAER